MSDFKIVSLLNPGNNYNNVSGILAASLSGNTDGVLALVSTGTLVLAGGNNITLSQDGQSVSIIGGAGGGGGGGIALAAGTQTATTNTIVFSNSNGISFGMSGSTRVTASYTVPSTAGLISAVNISGGTTSNNLSALTFSNANGVSFGLNGSVLTGTVATNYQSQGAYLTTAMQSNAATISNVNVSAGTTSNNLSAFVLSNSNNVSFGLNGSTVTATATFSQTNQTMGWYAVGNTTSSASSTTLDARTISINALGGVSAGYSNGSVQISAPPVTQLTGSLPVSLSSAGSTITIALVPISQWDPHLTANALVSQSSLGQSSLFFYPVDLPYIVSASRINFFLSIGTTSSNAASSGSGSVGIGYAIYTRGTGASSERISRLTSYSAAILSYTSSSGSQLGVTHINGLSNATSHSTATTALSTSNASTYMANSVGGFRAIPLPVNLTMTPGRYWIGFSQQSTNNAAASFNVLATYLQQTVSNFLAYRPMGTSSAASNASVYGFIDGAGTYSAQSAGWPASIGLSNSDIMVAPIATLPYFNLSGISNTTNLL